MADSSLPQAYYRGGADLTPRLRQDVRIDPDTGLVRKTHGISLYDDPAWVEQFGGAYLVKSIPAGLRIIQRGQNPHHFELTPNEPMTFERYVELLAQVVLRAVTD